MIRKLFEAAATGLFVASLLVVPPGWLPFRPPVWLRAARAALSAGVLVALAAAGVALTLR